jgi:hypothetical protein
MFTPPVHTNNQYGSNVICIISASILYKECVRCVQNSEVGQSREQCLLNGVDVEIVWVKD